MYAQNLGFGSPQQHIFFVSNQQNACFGSFSTFGTPDKTLYLLNKKYDFKIFELMPKNFVITTKNGSGLFNTEFLKDTSPVINEFLAENPNHLQYHIDVNDERNVLGKFELLYQGQSVLFEEDDIPTYQTITSMLRITRCPRYTVQNQMGPPGFFAPYLDNIKSGAKISQNSFEMYITINAPKTFTINTKKKSYKCNVFGILSSTILCELITKDPTKNQYDYDFEDEFNEFQSICDLLNFQNVKITPNNANILRDIAEDLQISYIIDDLNKAISEFDITSEQIDEQQIIVDSIDELFDWLYNIKELSAEKVKNSIIESSWSKTEESVQELAAFILQAIGTDFSLHPYLVDLLEQLDKNKNESNNLKILLPFVIKHLMLCFGQDKPNCSFIYNLYKKGHIPLENIIQKIQKPSIYNFQMTENIYSWFLPELVDNHLYNDNLQLSISNQFSTGFNTNPVGFSTAIPAGFNTAIPATFNSGFGYFGGPNQNNQINNYQSFVKLYYPNKIEAYKEMRDSGEPQHELTLAIRHDDVDKVQSILSRNENDISKCTIPFNIFEDFIPNGTTRYINYAAAYGSVKCFKYLLLNHQKIDEFTFKLAVNGGNNEIIKIVDQTPIEPQPINQTIPFGGKAITNVQNMNKCIIPSICKHRNDIFDWIIDNKYQDFEKTNQNLLELIIISTSNGNAHSLIKVIDSGFDINSKILNTKSLIQLAAEKGFCKLAYLIYNITKRAQQPQLTALSKANPFGAINQPNTLPMSINTTYSSAQLLPPNIENFVKFGNFDIFKLGAEIFPSDLERALAKAAVNDFPKIMDYILNEFAKDKKKITTGGVFEALNASLMRKSNQVFNYLLQKYDEIDPKFCKLVTSTSQMELLTTACASDNFEGAKKMIELIVEKETKQDFAIPFIRAASSGSIEICHLFIDQKLEIDYDQLSNNFFDLGSVDKKLFSLVIQNANQNLKDKFLLKSLQQAILKRNFDLVDYLLSQKVPYENILFDAVNSHDVEMVETILKNNDSPSFVNRRTEYGSALFYAARNNDIPIIKRLLAVPGIDVNIFDQRNQSILMHLCESNKSAALQIFLDTGLANTNLPSPQNGNTLLMQSIDIGNNEIAKLLISYDKTDINAQNYQKQTALTIAAYRNNIQMIDTLINNEKFNPDESRLNHAFYISNGESSRHLINAKDLDVNYRNIQKNNFVPQVNVNQDPFGLSEVFDTPLMHAVEVGNYDIIDLIVNHPTYDKEKSRVESAIFISVRRDDVRFFRRLLELDSRDINTIKIKKVSIYAAAVLTRSSNIISELLDNPQFKPEENDIPMTFVNAFNFKDNEILNLIQKLLDYCKDHEGLVDFKKELPNGKSFYTMISRQTIGNIEEIVNVLAECGVDPNKPDKFGVYPLENAIRINYYDYVVALLNLNKIDYTQKIPLYKQAQNINMPPYPNSNFSNNSLFGSFNKTGTFNAGTGTFGTGTGAFNAGTGTFGAGTGAFNAGTGTFGTGTGTFGTGTGAFGTGFNYNLNNNLSQKIDNDSNEKSEKIEANEDSKEKSEKTEANEDSKEKSEKTEANKDSKEKSEKTATNEDSKEKSEKIEANETTNEKAGEDKPKPFSFNTGQSISNPSNLCINTSTGFSGFNFGNTNTFGNSGFNFGNTNTFGNSGFNLGNTNTFGNSGFNLGQPNNSYKTYLHFAAVSQNSDILMEFINRRLIDINIEDDKGNTPLIDACRYRQRENIENILNLDDVDFLHKNKDGIDALKTLSPNSLFSSSFGTSFPQSAFGSSAFGSSANKPVPFGTNTSSAFGQINHSNIKNEEEIKDKDEYSKRIMSFFQPIATGFTNNTATTNNATGFGATINNTAGFGATTNKATGFGATTNKATGFGATINNTTGFGATTNKATGFGATINNTTGFGATINNATGFNFGNFESSNQKPEVDLKKYQIEIENAVLGIFKDATKEEVSRLKKAISDITKKNAGNDQKEEQKEAQKEEQKEAQKEENKEAQKEENQVKQKVERLEEQREELSSFENEIAREICLDLNHNEEEEEDLYQIALYPHNEMIQQEWQNMMQMNYIRQANFERQLRRNVSMLQNQSSKKKRKRKHHKQ